jgi:hypothetical protein
LNDARTCYDPRSCESLLGYGRAVHKKWGGVCQYCGLGKDGLDFDTWRQLSIDHVIPDRLFPGQARPFSSVFPQLTKAQRIELAKLVNEINWVTACNFCNSMTSRMKGDDVSADGILPPEDHKEVMSVNDEPVQAMLGRLRKRVCEVLRKKQDYVRPRLAELQKAFDSDVKPELQSARDPQGTGR